MAKQMTATLKQEGSMAKWPTAITKTGSGNLPCEDRRKHGQTATLAQERKLPNNRPPPIKQGVRGWARGLDLTGNGPLDRENRTH